MLVRARDQAGVRSHGWEGFRTNSIAQVENLVSQGYVVIAIDHTHVAVATVIDGEPVYIDDAALGDPDADLATRQQAEAEIIDVMAQDIRLVLDEVEAGAEGAFGELAAAMDPTSVGLWGHGMGGAAALLNAAMRSLKAFPVGFSATGGGPLGFEADGGGLGTGGEVA